MTELSVVQQTAAEALRWLESGRRVVAGLLVDVEGSAPFDTGASMYVDDHQHVEGSITGGCVEAAVTLEARQILDTDGSPRLVTYGVSDELAGSVGLTCGGTVQVLIHELQTDDRPAMVASLTACIEERSASLLTVVDGELAGRKMFVDTEQVIGTLGGSELLDHNAEREARGLLAQGRTAVRSFGGEGASLGSGIRVHVATLAPRPRMLIFGANDFSAAIAGLADWFGFRVTVVDPRSTFLASKRFSRVAQTLAVWPEEALRAAGLSSRDAIVVCTHDPKLDVPAVLGAIRSEAGYVGALGSRRTTADRAERLAEAGASPAELAQLQAPSGLDIGAATAEETALAVIAEIVARRSGRDGGFLCDGVGPIRQERDAALAAS